MATLFYPVRTWAAVDKMIVVDKNMRCKTLESYDGWERALQNPALLDKAKCAGGSCLDMLRARDEIITIDSKQGGSLPDEFALISSSPTQTEDSIRSCQNQCTSGCEACHGRLLKFPSLKPTRRSHSAPSTTYSDNDISDDDEPRRQSPPPEFNGWETRQMTASPIPAQEENYDSEQEPPAATEEDDPPLDEEDVSSTDSSSP